MLTNAYFIIVLKFEKALCSVMSFYILHYFFYILYYYFYIAILLLRLDLSYKVNGVRIGMEK